MTSVSKPLLGVLLAAVALFAGVMVFFKGNSSSASGTSNSGVYQSAIDKAHQAVKTSNAANARIGAPTATTEAAAPSHTAKASQPSRTTHTVKPAGHVAATKPVGASKSAVARVEVALSRHKVVGLLFYNPAASDDQAVKTELSAAATRPGVVKMAVPVTDVAQFTMLTNTVPVSSSPTLVMIDRGGSASTLSGFADRFEIAQRVADALAAR
jgi:hypothetical protein